MPVYGARYRHRDHYSITSCDPIFPKKVQEFRVLFYTRYFACITKSNTATPPKTTTKKQTNKKKPTPKNNNNNKNPKTNKQTNKQKEKKRKEKKNRTKKTPNPLILADSFLLDLI